MNGMACMDPKRERAKRSIAVAPHWPQTIVLLCGLGYLTCRCAATPAHGQALPDSPGVLLTKTSVASNGSISDLRPSALLPESSSSTGATESKSSSCPARTVTLSPEANASAESTAQPASCTHENPIQPFVNNRRAKPLSPRDKAYLAFRDVADPFNLLTIGGYSAFAVAANAHSAFGPGMEGWGKLSGYSLLEDSQFEFVGTFLLCSLAHQDPRYHRLQHGPAGRRILHAIGHSYLTAHDDGSRMPNYANLLNYPISAELANLYVPGIATNAPSTARRIGIGLATDPTGTLVAEFLPDVARHIHVRVIFIQEIVNQVVTGGTAPNVQ